MKAKVVSPHLGTQKRLMRKAIKELGGQKQLAQAASCSQPMVWKLVHGRSRISVAMARRIDRATGGKCKESDLRPDFFAEGEAEVLLGA